MVHVQVTEGILEGVEVVNEYGGKIYSFKGIPYAQPPLGDLRFKAPQPIKPWSGVRSAKEHGHICYQYDIFLNNAPSGSEDCLYLNIYSPNLKPNKLLPVMFWIHGGGFSSGSGNEEIYGPEFLVRHDVILVTINYRTEVLGFLSLETEDIPGNAGMKDQVAALRWVKNNVKYFGGDPENITIFGQSAGAACVTFLLVSPMAKGLFKRAIAQSGAATNYWGIATEPRERAKALARKLGFDSDNDKQLYEFFISQPVESLIEAIVPITLQEEALEKKELLIQYSIVNERQFGDNERFFYGDIYDVLRNGIHEGVEVIAGYCQDEALLVLGISAVEETVANYKKYIELFTPKEIFYNSPLKSSLEVGRTMKQFYFGNKDVSLDTLNYLFKFVTMNMFSYSILQWLKISSTKNKTYLYKFSCKSERNWLSCKMSEITNGKLMTCHAEDLPYLFTCKMLQQQIDKNSETFKLINNVTTLWTNFAKFGNPTPDSSLGVQWKPFTAEDPSYLDIGNQLVLSTNPENEELMFWESIFQRYYPHCLA